jgi:hypothetical protein
MNCKFCNKELNTCQVYEFIRGKSKGFCSRKCSSLFNYYGSNENYINQTTRNCIICNNKFYSQPYSTKSICSLKCLGVTTAKRMSENNPMANKETREKASNTLKRIGHKPIIQGGNGRGATIYQQDLFSKLKQFDNSFYLEYIFKTKNFNQDKIYPTHYKIDIGSDKFKIAIEIDGTSHNSNKVKQCDIKKTNLLTSQGWKVLRLSNSQIKKELNNCAEMVLSMI